MWDIKLCKGMLKGKKGVDFHLNHVGYKDALQVF